MGGRQRGGGRGGVLGCVRGLLRGVGVVGTVMQLPRGRGGVCEFGGGVLYACACIHHVGNISHARTPTHMSYHIDTPTPLSSHTHITTIP